MSDATGLVPVVSVDPVEGALRLLEGVEARPVEEHPAVFEAVHDALRVVLSDEPRA